MAELGQYERARMKLKDANLPPELLGAKLPPLEASVVLHRFITPELSVAGLQDANADPDAEIWVEMEDGIEYVCPDQPSGVSLFMPLDNKGTKSLHSMRIGAGLECRRNVPSQQLPPELSLCQDGIHPLSGDRPALLHFTARPANRMSRTAFEGALTSFLSVSCRPANYEAASPVLWDSDDPWPRDLADRVTVWALRQFGSSQSASPQQALMCWLIYHDIKACGIGVESFLRHDSKAGRTVATALQHIERQRTRSSWVADDLLHAFSKVLVGYMPRYLDGPPKSPSDSDSDSDSDCDVSIPST